MDDNNENNRLKTVELKTRERSKLPTKEEESLAMLNESRRQRGFICEFPKFIPTDPQGTILSMTPEEQDKVLEDMLSHPEKRIFKHDICIRRAQKPDELSLPETLVMLNESRRQRGIICEFPKFIPPPTDPEGTILSMTPEEQDKVLEDMLSHPEKMIFKRDLYTHPAQKPDELSLPEVEDDIARELLYADGEYPIRKKKHVVSIGKQKKKVASSSKRPMTNA